MLESLNIKAHKIVKSIDLWIFKGAVNGETVRNIFLAQVGKMRFGSKSKRWNPFIRVIVFYYIPYTL